MTKITKKQAREIAREAKEYAGYDIFLTTGSHKILQDEEDDIDYRAEINKVRGYGMDDYYAIRVTSDDDDSYWEYTDSLCSHDLACKLLEIADDLESEMLIKRIRRAA